MRIGDIPVAAVAARVGTPAYVYDGPAMDDRARRLRAALPVGVDLAYAVKANPAPAVVGRLGAAGLGADVASAGELRLALRAGIPAERIVVTGPGKTPALHAAAVRAGVRAVTVESPGELARLESIAAECGGSRPVGVLLRAAASALAAATDDRGVIGATPGKFGMDRDDLAIAVRHAAASPRLDWLGLHAFTATNLLDATVLLDHARATLDLAADLAASTGQPARIVDLGGGLGIPYRDADLALDVDALGRGLAEALAAAADRHGRWVQDARLILEPGRWLVGPAGWYLTRVIDAKRVDGQAVAVVDGGIHHLLRPALVGEPHRITAVNHDDRREWPDRREPVSVVGPLCTGLDTLDAAACLPPLRPGDLLAIHDVGAYGFTESMPFFLSHPTPPEVLVEGTTMRVIRPAMHPERWLGDEAAALPRLGA